MEDKIKHYKLGNTIQEFEELFGNTPFEDIEKIKKHIKENYIPKSKIKEKIEEYTNSILENLDEDRRWCDMEIVDNFERLKQELLGDE